MTLVSRKQRGGRRKICCAFSHVCNLQSRDLSGLKLPTIRTHPSKHMTTEKTVSIHAWVYELMWVKKKKAISFHKKKKWSLELQPSRNVTIIQYIPSQHRPQRV